MFDVHWSELMLVALAALLILGPKDFVKFMHTVGRWVREAKLAFYKINAAMDAANFEAEEMDKKQDALPPSNADDNKKE